MYGCTRYNTVASAIAYEFQRNFNKELESTRSRIEDTKRLIDDIISELKVMVKDKDLKNLEGQN